MEPVRPAHSRGLVRHAAALAFSLAFVLLSCHLDQGSKVENTLSFTSRYDALKDYDTLRIEVKDAEGKSLGVIYQGKPSTAAQLENLHVPGWQDGPIVIVISGYEQGVDGPVFQEEIRYNGSTRKTENTAVLRHPNPTLSAATPTLTLQVGQRVPLPDVDVNPPNLSDSALRWSSDKPGIAAVEGGNLVAVAAGTASLKAALVRDTTRSVVIAVQVDADLRAPERLTLDRDTLYLAQYGGQDRFGIRVDPVTASSAVTWRLQESTLVAQRSDGAFIGLEIGVTKVWAVSQFNSAAKDSGWIRVGPPQPVTSVRFRAESLVLYRGGMPESLDVEVLPPAANQEVLFSLSDTGKASLQGGLLVPKALGEFTVRVRSQEDTSKTDLLPVSVREAVPVQRVQVLEKAVTLYLGGPDGSLAARVHPEGAPQGVRWQSLSPGIVIANPLTGGIEAVQPGIAVVVATSQADTSRRDSATVTVQRDIPRLSVAADTVVSAGTTVEYRVTASQEFGQVVQFLWDLDGDQVWDDTLAGPWTGASVELPAVSRKYDRSGRVTARFRVVDSEGNPGTATWTVRVVGGAAVSIDSPEDNSYTNQRRIAVAWSVNGTEQDSLLFEDLAALGPNVVRRSARDSAGRVHMDSIVVHLDTVAPLKPLLSGTSPTNTRPRWTWTSGGGGGSGDFRYRLGDANFPATAASVRDTQYVLADDPASGARYTLYVQERDLAGNWSPAGSLEIVYDVSKPVVTIAAPQASGTHYTSSAAVALSGTAAGPQAVVRVTYRIGSGAPADATFASGSGAWTTPPVTLQEGSLVGVTVIAADQAGNTGEATLNLFLDATPPAAPTITTAPAAAVAAMRGDFGWTPGSDGPTGSGLNGRYRYRVNGGAWKDTSAALLTALPLADGNNTFEVQEQDRALLWSPSASRVVRVDTAGPAITLTGQNPRTSASLSVTLAGTVRDSTGPVSMSVTGQVAGGGAVTVTGTSWTTAALTLASGANTLVLTAVDALGNERALSVVVNVNVPAPRVVITNPADSLTLTNQSSIVVTYTVDGGAPQTQTFTMTSDGVYRHVVATPPNASGNIGRDTVKVTRDATQPNAPNVPAPATPTRNPASWTWTSAGDNTGGAGMRTPAQYRYSLNNGTTWTETNTASHQVGTEGSHTLVVQELDRAGNWSPSSTPRTVVVDLTPPSVAIISPTRENYVTNRTTVTLQYRVDNSTTVRDTVCNLTVADGRNTCRVRVLDNVGNPGWDSTYVWRRGTVFFVTPAGAGLRDGSDWENAMDSTRLVAAVEARANAGRTYWIGNGNYPHLAARFNASFLGGFLPSSFPYNTNNRNKSSTRLASFHVGDTVTTSLDGFTTYFFSGGNVPTLTLTDITILPPTTNDAFSAFFFPYNGNTITANNLVIDNSSYTYTTLYVGDGTVTLNGGSIRDNFTSDNTLQVFGTMNLNSPFVLSGNRIGNSTEGDYQVTIAASGRLTIGTGVNVTCTAPMTLIEAGGVCTKR